jgi:hypothetical protein
MPEGCGGIVWAAREGPGSEPMAFPDAVQSITLYSVVLTVTPPEAPWSVTAPDTRVQPYRSVHVQGKDSGLECNSG